MAYIKTDDESILDQNRKILFFSIERFIRDIAEGECCFICGVSPDLAEFNDEHVIPDWILRKYGLHKMMITLPNGTTFRYDQYKVPCCKKCNELLSQTFEEPISDLVNQGYGTIVKHVNDNGPWLFFNWLALLFFKTHLKDKSLRLHRDLRQKDQKIADYYTWEELHHIHCVVRSFYTGCQIDNKVLGSLLVLPAEIGPHIRGFDYADLYPTRTVMLRLGQVAFIAVLNDSRAARIVLRDLLKKIDGPLSPPQLREIMLRVSFINANLKDRPVFHSEFIPKEDRCIISAEIPEELVIEEYDPNEFGVALYAMNEETLSLIKNPNADLIRDLVKQGKYTFLFDENGNFVRNSLVFVNKPTIAPDKGE